MDVSISSPDAGRIRPKVGRVPAGIAQPENRPGAEMQQSRVDVRFMVLLIFTVLLLGIAVDWFTRESARTPAAQAGDSSALAPSAGGEAGAKRITAEGEGGKLVGDLALIPAEEKVAGQPVEVQPKESLKSNKKPSMERVAVSKEDSNTLLKILSKY